MNTQRMFDAAAIRARVVVVLTVVVIGCLISLTLMEVPYWALVAMFIPPVLLQGLLTYELCLCKTRPSGES